MTTIFETGGLHDHDHEEFFEDKERKRRKRAWKIFSLALLVFLGGAAWPVVQDRIFKWRSVGDARRLAVWAQEQRLRAIRAKSAIRFRFVTVGNDRVAVAEFVTNCDLSRTSEDNSTPQELDRKVIFDDSQFTWIDESVAKSLNIRASSDHFCIPEPAVSPPVIASSDSLSSESPSIQFFWAWIPRGDVASKRIDRVTVVSYDPERSSFDFR